MVRGKLAILGVAAFAAGPFSVMAADDIPEIRILGRPLPPSANEPIYATTLIDRDALDQAGEARLDDALKSVPGFGLFRRQSSRASHPTTQGVTLRGLGPSGAGRTLVLLDGVPQNDAFGGWIDWSRLPTPALQSTLITRGGGAGPWGNAALAGVIRLQSRVGSEPFVAGEVRGDSLESVDATASFQTGLDPVQLFGTFHGHTSEGSYLIREDQRGPVDKRTADRGTMVRLGARFALGDDIDVVASGGYSRDRYKNGIAIAVSHAEVADGSVSFIHDGGKDAISWEGHVYVRSQGFDAIFSSINATRTLVTPSLNQFDVPATAVGANAIVRVPISTEVTLETGADVRTADGATNEDATFIGNAFTRRRHAGGDQTMTGAFAELNWLPMPELTLTAGGRFDYWQQANGARTETVIATGVVARNDIYPTTDGTVANYRVGARYATSETFALRAVTYSGFRVPTLNELYRPFRVGNDITEANPGLKPERVYGVEGGFEWTPSGSFMLSANYFHNWLHNAVGNITVQTTPGLNAALNVVVPAGGVLRQRQNIDRIEAEGVEITAKFPVSERFDLTADYLYTNPRVVRAAAQPSLQGLRLAEVARHQASLSAVYRPAADWTLKVEGRGASNIYDDDQNARLLRGYVVLDLYADYAVTPRVTVFVSGENVTDKTVEAGKSADGIVTVGTPQTFAGGVRFRF